MCSGKKCLCPQNDPTEQIIFFSCHRCTVFILYELVIIACHIFPSWALRNFQKYCCDTVSSLALNISHCVIIYLIESKPFSHLYMSPHCLPQQSSALEKGLIFTFTPMHTPEKLIHPSQRRKDTVDPWTTTGLNCIGPLILKTVFNRKCLIATGSKAGWVLWMQNSLLSTCVYEEWRAGSELQAGLNKWQIDSRD